MVNLVSEVYIITYISQVEYPVSSLLMLSALVT